MVNLQEFAIDLRNYFKCCPICFSSANGTFNAHITNGGTDTLSCNVCGAKWNLYIVPLLGFQWAELYSLSEEGKGQEYLGKRLDKKKILAITQKESENKNQVIHSKEIIKEKELITKIRCSYCHNSYSELLDNCPKCGAKS